MSEKFTLDEIYRKAETVPVVTEQAETEQSETEHDAVHHASNIGGPGSIPGQGTRPCMLQLRPSAAK